MKGNAVHEINHLTLFRHFAKNEHLTDLEFCIVCVFLQHNLVGKVVDGEALISELGLSKNEMYQCLKSMIKKGVLEEAGEKRFYLVAKL